MPEIVLAHLLVQLSPLHDVVTKVMRVALFELKQAYSSGRSLKLQLDDIAQPNDIGVGAPCLHARRFMKWHLLRRGVIVVHDLEHTLLLGLNVPRAESIPIFARAEKSAELIAHAQAGSFEAFWLDAWDD